MNGAQCIVMALQSQKVKTVFGYPGGTIMPLYDALYDDGIEHLLCRHEQGAAMAAVGYARATGNVGVCIATSGPGSTNLITGLADALSDSIPVVAITGQVATSLIGTDAFQEIDTLGLSLACTKHSFLVRNANELPNIIQEAFHIAMSGRPGPVLVDIPKDIQLTDVLQPYFSLPATQAQVDERVQVEQAIAMLKAAKKPVICCGGGVGMANAVSELREFIAITGIPSVVTLKGIGSADHTAPHYLGMLGMHGTKAGNLVVQEADLLIAVGVRFDDRLTGNLNQFAPNAKVIHLDVDPAELGKLRQAHVALQGDLKTHLPRLTCQLMFPEWHKRVEQLKQQTQPDYAHPNALIYAPHFLKQLSDKKPNSAVVTTDVGQHQMWAAQHMDFTSPKNFITSGGLGTMGFGLPAAIGAQMARRDDMVICVTGDGSFMMNVQELATIKRKQLPIKIVLLDNQRLGMVRQWQELFFDGRYSETNLSDNPDFLCLASAFGIPGQRITHKDQIEGAIEDLLTSRGPYLLHVSIDEQANVWPLVPPGAGNETMLEETV